MNVVVRRERTAMYRTRLSAPARQALDDGILRSCQDVLDYGCGRGDDVKRLRASGLDARGWDPFYAPDPGPSDADAVLLTYVINVIEDPRERRTTLREAHGLARRVLVVAARTQDEERDVVGRSYGDGVLTNQETFHRLYRSDELRSWVQDVVGVPATPASPGLIYVFRHSHDRLSFLARRHSLDVSVDPNGAVLDRLVSFLEGYGRAPVAEEAPGLHSAASRSYGAVARAVLAARHIADDTKVQFSAWRRRVDLLVVLALECFHGERRSRDLPPALEADVRALYPSFKEACRRSDWLLGAVGQPDQIRRAVWASRVGKRTPTALYLHQTALGQAPALLRVYAACAELVAGFPPETNLIKLHHNDKAMVSFLSYPDFDRDPHPRLATGLAVDLSRRKSTYTDWSGRSNRPLLHRKEEFLAADHPRAALYARLTRQEVRAGLYREPTRIGLEQGWGEVLRERGYRVQGHRLHRASDEEQAAVEGVDSAAS